MAIAVALGGQGVGAGLANMAVQLAAILVIALHPRAFTLFFIRSSGLLATTLAALMALSVLLPLFQLIPLPPRLWQAMPGRDMVTTSFALIGEQGWYPISLDPARTLTAFLSTLPPLAIIVVGSVLPRERLRRLVQAVAVMGIMAMLYGAVQVAGARSATVRMSATFADWNGAAIFFGGCLLLVVSLYPAKQGSGSAYPDPQISPLTKMLFAGAACLLVVGTVLTQSRTGIALLAVPLGLAIVRIVHGLALEKSQNGAGRARTNPALIAIAVGSLLAVGIGVAVWSGAGRLGAVSTRFETADDGKRLEMREDALASAERYWPVGAGMGTFDEVFQVDESLEYLSARRAGRAHMDYYELAIEAGIAGLMIAGAWLIWMLAASLKALRAANWLGLAGAGFLACCAAQSFLSFPLRSQTVLAMAGFAIVLLRQNPTRREPHP